MVKKVLNKTTFTQKYGDRCNKGLSWCCRKNHFNIEIIRSGLSWYILAHRTKDDAYWNSLWIKKRWDELDDAMDFVSKFDYEKLKAQL
jgi:hypothetical protein